MPSVVLGCRLRKILGSGSCATVYLARQESTGRKVVVKVAHPHLAREPFRRSILDRFATEFEAASRIQHPNLVRIFDVGLTAQGSPALVMEYIPGKTLHRFLERCAPLQLRHVIKLGMSLVSALHTLHSKRVLHRDVNPANIMITPCGRTGKLTIKLLDLGIAQLDGQGAGTVGPVGTPRYVAPEQLLGQAQPASDIYSVGAVLWWALTGTEYHVALEDKGSLRSFLRGELRSDPRSLRPEIPTQLASLLCDMLAPSPEERPDAQALHTHLQELLQSLTASSPPMAQAPELPPPPAPPQARALRRAPSSDPQLFFPAPCDTGELARRIDHAAGTTQEASQLRALDLRGLSPQDALARLATCVQPPSHTDPPPLLEVLLEDEALAQQLEPWARGQGLHLLWFSRRGTWRGLLCPPTHEAPKEPAPIKAQEPPRRPDRCVVLALQEAPLIFGAALEAASAALAQGMEVSLVLAGRTPGLLKMDRPLEIGPSQGRSPLAWLNERFRKRSTSPSPLAAAGSLPSMDNISRIAPVSLQRQLRDLAHQGAKICVCPTSLTELGLEKHDLIPMPAVDYGGVSAFVRLSQGAQTALVF